MQKMSTAPMRNDSMSSKVSVPAKAAPKTDSQPVQKSTGGSIKGFSGGIKPGKI